MKRTVVFILILFSTILYSQKPKMVYVEGGEMKIGANTKSSNNSKKTFPDETLHTVKINSFYIAKYEVLYDDYVSYCDKAGISAPYGENTYPVTNVTWVRAVMYCNWLSTIMGYERCYKIKEVKGKYLVECDFSLNGYRLPTEAEWEYAARGGVRSKGFT